MACAFVNACLPSLFMAWAVISIEGMFYVYLRCMRRLWWSISVCQRLVMVLGPI